MAADAIFGHALFSGGRAPVNDGAVLAVMQFPFFNFTDAAAVRAFGRLQLFVRVGVTAPADAQYVSHDLSPVVVFPGLSSGNIS